MAARSFCSALALFAALASGNARAQGWEVVAKPSPGAAEVIGGPAAGCIGGAIELPPDGIGYQAIRVSRNRHWGHPGTVRMVQKLAAALDKLDFAPIYIGDMSQPRGGPMNYGHASHQNGLDVDIWFNIDPKPNLAPAERENPELPWLVNQDQQSIDNNRWRSGHATMLRMAASFPEVDRIFVHWQIKKHLCESVRGDRAWLTKIRPWWGHAEHFHVRLSCPGNSPLCAGQAPNPPGDGCGSELAWWLDQGRPDRLKPPQIAAAPPPPPKPKLPAQCYGVLGKM